MVFVSFLCDNILTQRYWDKVLNHSFNQLFCICSVLSPRDKLKEYCIRCWMARTEWQTKICFVIWFLPFHFLSNILLIYHGRQHKVNQFDCLMSTTILCFLYLCINIFSQRKETNIYLDYLSLLSLTLSFSDPRWCEPSPVLFFNVLGAERRRFLHHHLSRDVCSRRSSRRRDSSNYVKKWK